MEKNRNRKEKSIVFLFSNKNIDLILFVLLSCIGAVTILNSVDGNMIIDIFGKNIANAQLVKSVEISNGKTDAFPLTFSNIGKYQYHCQYHPKTMHGNIVVS